METWNPSPYLSGRDRYERAMEGWTDNLRPGLLTHTVRVTDDDRGIEVTASCTPPPGYEMREVGARALGGDVDAALPEALAGLAGTTMVGGLTKRASALAAGRAGADLAVEAVVEVARLARQVAQMPPEAVAGLLDARRCWTLDHAAFPDVAGSCFVFTEEAGRLLAVRPVVAQAGPAVYSPSPGARRVFVRRKRARLVRTGPRLDLFHSMHDDVHGFDLHFQVDLDSRTVVAAGSILSRLPYRGLCDEPQGRVKSMIGQRVDDLLRRRAQGLLGGETGCSQLFDLTADLLKLLTPAPAGGPP